MPTHYRVRLKAKVKLKLLLLFISTVILVSIIIFKFGDIGSYSVSEGDYFKANIISVNANRATGLYRTPFTAKLNYTAEVLNKTQKRVEAGGMWKIEKNDIVCVAELINSKNKEVINYLIVTDEKCT